LIRSSLPPFKDSVLLRPRASPTNGFSSYCFLQSDVGLLDFLDCKDPLPPSEIRISLGSDFLQTPFCISSGTVCQQNRCRLFAPPFQFQRAFFRGDLAHAGLHSSPLKNPALFSRLSPCLPVSIGRRYSQECFPSPAVHSCVGFTISRQCCPSPSLSIKNSPFPKVKASSFPSYLISPAPCAGMFFSPPCIFPCGLFKARETPISSRF